MISDKYVTPQVKAVILQILADPATLVPAELALLNTEFSKAQYTALRTPEAKASLYNREMVVDNPVSPAPKVAVTFLSLPAWGRLQSSMLGALRAQQAAAMTANPPTTPNPLIQTLIDTINEQDAAAKNVGGVDITGSAYQHFRPLAIALGAISNDALTLVENQDDPTWTAKITVCPRLTVLAGQPHANAYAEASDVALALAFTAPTGG